MKLPTPLFAVMLDQLNFVLEILFFNDIISVRKINIYQKVFIVDDTIPEITMLLKLSRLYVFNLWWFEIV